VRLRADPGFLVSQESDVIHFWALDSKQSIHGFPVDDPAMNNDLESYESVASQQFSPLHFRSGSKYDLIALP